MEFRHLGKCFVLEQKLGTRFCAGIELFKEVCLLEGGEMSCRYQVVEKSSKRDGQGNLLCELWLKDAVGGYSLLRLGKESFEGLHLGDQIELALHIVCHSEGSMAALEVPQEGSHA
jgi:hypothetical protein